MSDDLKRTKPEDPTKINLGQAWEVAYWTKELSVSEARLRRAVAAAGVMVSAVRTWLRNNP